MILSEGIFYGGMLERGDFVHGVLSGGDIVQEYVVVEPFEMDLILLKSNNK